ncbi:MAG: hypothetical protein J5U19_15570 [Candidatus Methanoperedens sp.]|nr:hypothetical protein [Candidatus Methanoperedens sp.]
MKTKLKSHKKSYLLVVVLIVSFLLIGTGWIARQAVGQNKSMGGFVIKEIRFDESMGDEKPTPKIPKSWRLVGVSNGENMNYNNLWFQDSDGNIYLVQGFVSYGQFILQPSIGKIRRE